MCSVLLCAYECLIILVMKKKTNDIIETVEPNEAKPKKKIKWWKLSIEIIGGLALVGVGVYAGIFVGQMAFVQKRDYSKFKVEKQDYTSVYSRYQSLNPSSYYSYFKEAELINIGLLNISKSEHFYAVTRGNVLANVNGIKQEQDILQTFIKNGSNYFEEDISYGIVKTGLRFYQDSNNELTIYHTSSISKTGENESGTLYQGNYKYGEEGEDKTILNSQEFTDIWGRETLSDSIVYYINDQTVISASKSKETNGDIKVSVELEPILSVLKYVKQMKNTGGLSQDPIFYSVKIDFVLDKDLFIKSFTTDESYQVVSKIFPVPAESHGTLTMEYFYETREIPSMEEITNFDK